MQKILMIFVLSMTATMLTGCKDVLEQIVAMDQYETSSDEAYIDALKIDVKNFDRIRTSQNSLFIDLDEKLKQATNKNTSTVELRQELEGIGRDLRYQNDQFKIQHFNTNEVAQLRNKVMKLNYLTVEIIDVLQNPNTVANRLPRYVNQQKKLLNEYNQLRTDIETQI